MKGLMYHNMLSPELISKIKQIQFKAGFLANDALAGEYSSVFRGLGQEFDKVREYHPGDDIRTIDWNVTARMNEPFVKVYKEEREMTLMLLVDVSPSQRFGTTGRFKQEIVAELAALVSFLATKNNDKVGLIIFSDHVEKYIPPKKGRSHVWNIIRSVLTYEGRGKSTDISGALEYLNKVCKKKTACFLFSDFESDDFAKSITMTAKKHNLYCCLVKDPREVALPSCGILDFEDLESGETFVINSSDDKTRKIFQGYFDQKVNSLRKFFLSRKIDFFEARTDQSSVDPLISFFREKEKRKVR